MAIAFVHQYLSEKEEQSATAKPSRSDTRPRKAALT
jgi:hypothetical protein